MSNHQERPTYTMIKCEENNIQMINNLDSKVYRYIEPSKQHLQNLIKNLNPQQQNQSNKHNGLIVPAIPLCSGFVYQKQRMNLYEAAKLRKQLNSSKSIQNRERMLQQIQDNSKDYFLEEELNNTFADIVQWGIRNCWEGRSYGCFRLENILIDNQGNIKLKDPIISETAPYNDIKALGIVMYQCSTLQLDNFNEQHASDLKFFCISLNQYTVDFIAILWILIKQIKECYQCVIGPEINKDRNKVYEGIKKQIQIVKAQIKQKKKQQKQKSQESKQKARQRQTRSQNKKNAIYCQNIQKQRKLIKQKRQHYLLRNRNIIMLPPLGLLDRNQQEQEIQHNKMLNREFGYPDMFQKTLQKKDSQRKYKLTIKEQEDTLKMYRIWRKK